MLIRALLTTDQFPSQVYYKRSINERYLNVYKPCTFC
jgi:hypothetical protein